MSAHDIIDLPNYKRIRTVQKFKIYSEQGREDAINKMISEGWRVINFNSLVVSSSTLYINVLFERDIVE